MRLVSTFQRLLESRWGCPRPGAPLAVSSGGVAAIMLLLCGCGSSVTTSRRHEPTVQRVISALDPGTQTLVVQKKTIRTVSSVGGGRRSSVSFSVETISEISAAGSDAPYFMTDSFTKPGFQQVYRGESMEVYDPGDNTIYQTSQRALAVESARQAQTSLPKGAVSSSGEGQATAVSVSPGSSEFDQELREHRYRLDGHTTIDGLRVLKLVPRHTSYSVKDGPTQDLGTLYVAGSNYAPIRYVSELTAGNAPTDDPISSDTTSTWSEFRVLRQTPANLRLISLTARHPGARVVDSAAAYIRATSAQNMLNTRRAI